ncbi:MAG: helicase-related protein [Candidatus Methylacidiphilales bacterium]|nr:helicase-related protein [Candidatus Methylacidiphilales bacterium]
MSTPPNHSNLRDNQTRGSAADFLRQAIHPGSRLSFVSAYFTVHAYYALRDVLEQAGKLRFLFGEPSFVSLVDADKADSKHFRLTENGLSIGNALQQRPQARACADWIRQQVEIRSVVQSGFLHGKMYHVLPEKGNEAQAILGSSNFTVPGLGLSPTRNNTELNIILDSTYDRKDLLAWFDALWNDSAQVADVKDEVLKHLERLYGNQSPQFIYYLTLYHVFRRFLDENTDADLQLDKTNLFDSQIWQKLFSFQKDGVRGAIRRLRDYRGCILADSVGLGKTFEALAVIKYYQDRGSSILVLCPKKLWNNWNCWLAHGSADNILAKDRFNYHILAHTDLSFTKGQRGPIDLASLPSNYDLIVIDESHNFRNNAVGTETPDGRPRRTRYERLMQDIIQKGIRSHVLLLSATPVNNYLADLRNQISFIAGGDVARRERSANAAADRAFEKNLEIPSIFETTRKAQAEFTRWAKLPADQRSSKELLLKLGGDLFTLLDALSIARSRRQIERHYKAEMEHLGGFPHREKPHSEYPEIDTLGRFPTFQQLDAEISKLNLALYHPSAHLRKDLPAETHAAYERKIGNFNQEGRERILIAMMKVNFLKRLESSIDSFRLTLQRTLDKITKLETKLAAFEEHRDAHPEIDFDVVEPEVDDVDDGETDPEAFKIGGRHRIHLGHIDIPKWRKALNEDRTQLQYLCDEAKPIKPARDQKLQTVKTLLTAHFTNPDLNKEGEPIRKVILFTAFADTARYLHGELAAWAKDTFGVETALVAGTETRTSTGLNDFESILRNFSPRSKSRAQGAGPEIDLLIATDCISEGQNLQDCNFLINYDIHWNPVRIIQRFGRIDRIGSRHHRVRLVNFWPTKDLNAYLKVKERVESRMALVDLTASAEDNLLNTEQVDELISADLNYRNKQLKRLQEEVFDLEDLNDEGVTLADFSLDDFRLDLLDYLKANEDALQRAESGLYAVVPVDSSLPKCHPGVIFCFRHCGKGGKAEDSEKINPLHPYFLVYVLESGDIQYSFAAPKAILQLFRELAAGQTSAHDQLCELFDTRTKNGTDMGLYSDLAKKAVAGITRTFQKRAATSLLSSRGAVLPTASETPGADGDDLELVTWLVIQNP